MNASTKKRTLPWIIGGLVVFAIWLWFKYDEHQTRVRAQEREAQRQAAFDTLKQKYKAKDVALSATACAEPFSPLQPGKAQLTFGVTSQEWQSDNSLKLSANVLMGCELPVSGGGYGVVGEKVQLHYFVKMPDWQAACQCVYRMNYVIKGLEKKDYEFELNSQEY